MGIIKSKMVMYSETAIEKNEYEEFVSDIDIDEEDISVVYESFREDPLRSYKSREPVKIDCTVVIMKTGHKFILDIHKEDFDNKRRLCRL